MPRIDAGMNRIGPTNLSKGGKGSKDDVKDITLGQDKPKQDDAKILERARKRFDTCVSAESENRTAGLEDLKFKAGDQWPASIAAQRNNDHRPCNTVNKIPTFVKQIVNEQRQSRPAINVSPVGDRSDPEVAKMYRGLIRYLERASHADIAYDTAFESAASMGWGYWRVLTEYESPETNRQTIVIRRVRNTFSVYLDPTSQEPDGSDARYGFVTELIPRHEFEETYPDKDPMSWTESAPGDTYKNWIDEKNVRIAEYFEIMHDKRWVVLLSNGHEGFEDELSEAVQRDIKAGRLEVLQERESEIPRVDWYKLTAVEVIERKPWAGKWIPLPRVVGNEIDIEGKVKLSGIIRDAKEPQRMTNYASTMMTEAIALTPKAPFIGAEGQFEGHEAKWEQANTKSYPYLEYKPTTLGGSLVPPPARQQPSLPAAGWQQLLDRASQDMMATTGIRFDATVQERVVDESGRAMRELHRSSDVINSHYYDNLCRTLKHQGDIFLDLIPKIIDTKRMVTILREDDTEEQVQIDPKAEKPYKETRNPMTGKILKIFNPTIGKYGVTVTIGPSYATKRIEAAESMMDFVRALPQTAQFIADLVAKNQDWPEAEVIAGRLAKMLPPQLLQPDMKDITPQTAALLQSMDMQVKGLTQQLQMAAKALQDQDKDRAIEMDKISKDFEAKVLKIVADTEAKAAATQEKAVSNFNTHIGAQVKDLGEGVTKLIQQMERSDPHELPPEAMGHLSDGQVTTFENGSKWTQKNGKAHRVTN